MNILEQYKKLVEQANYTEKDPEFWGIINYSWNDDGTLDVRDYDGVRLNDKNLTKLPFKFGKVLRWFDCSGNKLTTLEGSPRQVVDGDFWCYHNNLTTLEGAPKEVGGGFYCYNNPDLVALKGFPRKIKGNVDVRSCGRTFTEENIRARCNVGGEVYTDED